MSFKKVNPLFAFDSLTCERTQAFDLPATPTNDRVLELAKIPAYYGAGMRQRFDAELQDGTIVKQGYLYVDKYAKGKYSAVFVTGELFGLLKIKNAGKIAELADFTSFAMWQSANASDANTTEARVSEFDIIRYKDAHGGTPFPSILVHKVAKRCAQALGVTISGWPTSTQKLRMVTPKIKGFENIPITIRSDQGAIETWQDAVEVNTSHSTINTVLQPTYMAFGYPLYRFTIEAPYPDSWWQSNQDSGARHTIAAWKAMVDVDIKIPDDFPDSMYMVEQIPPTYSRTWEGWKPCVFYGGYEFGQDGQHALGTPLRGRTIRVEAGKLFTFVTGADFRLLPADRTKYADGDLVAASWWESDADGAYIDRGQPGYQFRLEVSQVTEMSEEGAKVYEIGTLPDVTLVDLLKCIASVSGTAINYTDSQGLTFDELDISTWPTIGLGSVLSISELTRKFGKYAKRNIVKCKSGKNVFAGEKLTTVYTIQNENLDESNTLQELPFSEAGLSFDNSGNPVAYIRGNESDGTSDEWSGMLANDADGSIYMSRVSLYKNANLQALCDASTSVTVSARMTLAEYEELAAKVTILYAGTLYVWTEANWSDGKVTLKLSKVA